VSSWLFLQVVIWILWIK